MLSQCVDTWAVFPKQVILKAFAIFQVGQKNKDHLTLRATVPAICQVRLLFPVCVLYTLAQNMHFVLVFMVTNEVIAELVPLS